jgi:hypothetical protein
MSDPKNTLEEKIGFNERLSTYGGWAVLAGLVIEVVLSVVYRDHESVIENWGPVFATSLIAIGVWAEIHFAGRVSRTEEELRRQSEERVAEANARTAEARENAALAIERAASLERDAAYAKQRTAELEKAAAWRHIDADQSKRIADAIRDIAPLFNVVIECERGDPESFRYAWEIGDVFTKAGTENVQLNRHSSFPGMPPFGVFLLHLQNRMQIVSLLRFLRK